MNIIYAQEPIRPSIFLAGPSPRHSSVVSWRPSAYRILEKLKFDGDVYSPEPREHTQGLFSYDGQITWEWTGLNTATAVVFWIPRSEELPGFTTNVEFGMLVSSGKSVLGYPPGADKTHYLHKLADRYGVHVYHDLQNTLAAAMLLSTWTKKTHS